MPGTEVLNVQKARMERRAGILLHPLSLPGATGGGVLDSAVDTFLEFCTTHHQSIWQVLPLGPTGYGNSPYQSFSTHAGNPYLISLKDLADQGLATDIEVNEAEVSGEQSRVNYAGLYEIRLPVLFKVASSFHQRANLKARKAYAEFCHDEDHWLDDYALYAAIKGVQQSSWQDWPQELRERDAASLHSIRTQLAPDIEAHKVLQWMFATQWAQVRVKANKAGVKILGDLPIFVAMDSADAWANPDLFLLSKKSCRPLAVAGVPPDYFSADGQLWGNPLYRWPAHLKEGFRWWKGRMRSALRLYDSVRIDHFRGFAQYWCVPAGAKTAREGSWKKSPGAPLLRALKQEFPQLPLVAEDLGDITPDVYALRDKFGLPGMKVLQFAFSNPTNEFLPHRHGTNFVVYTGTHDNDTTLGWLSDPQFKDEQRFFRHYLGLDVDVPLTLACKQMVRMALRSVADTVIIAMQDVLALDGKARMNTPSVGTGNWEWRLTFEQVREQQDWFREATWMTDRVR